MPHTIRKLSIGLDRTVNRRSWIFVHGTGLARGYNVVITASHDSINYRWEGTIQPGHVLSDTDARVHVRCTAGIAEDTQDDVSVDDDGKKTDVPGRDPGDLTDIDVTVTNATGGEPSDVTEEGVLIYP